VLLFKVTVDVCVGGGDLESLREQFYLTKMKAPVHTYYLKLINGLQCSMIRKFGDGN